MRQVELGCARKIITLINGDTVADTSGGGSSGRARRVLRLQVKRRERETNMTRGSDEPRAIQAARQRPRRDYTRFRARGLVACAAPGA